MKGSYDITRENTLIANRLLSAKTKIDSYQSL